MLCILFVKEFVTHMIFYLKNITQNAEEYIQWWTNMAVVHPKTSKCQKTPFSKSPVVDAVKDPKRKYNKNVGTFLPFRSRNWNVDIE